MLRVVDAETVDAAIEAGATHIGLVHFEPSPRHVPLDLARELREQARGKAKVVLLMVNADPELTGRALNAIKPDIIQFHGSETPEWIGGIRRSLPYEVWKAVGLKDAGTLTRSRKYIGKVDRLLARIRFERVAQIVLDDFSPFKQIGHPRLQRLSIFRKVRHSRYSRLRT